MHQAGRGGDRPGEGGQAGGGGTGRGRGDRPGEGGQAGGGGGQAGAGGTGRGRGGGQDGDRVTVFARKVITIVLFED